jgi:hypothetical protein
MSIWYEAPGNCKDCWYWSGLAISHAQRIGLCRTPPNGTRDTDEQGRRRRLWWSCFVQDRLIALGMKLPTRLKEDYDMQMLKVDDFSLGKPPLSIPLRDGVSWDAPKQRRIANICIQKTKLCVCINRLILMQESIKRMNQQATIGPNDQRSGASSADLETKFSKLQLCEDEFQDWLTNIPDDVRLDRITTPSMDLSLSVHIATVHLIYFCAYAFLQRSHLSLLTPEAPFQQKKGVEALDSPRAKICSAARAVTEITQQLRNLDLIRYLPHSAVISFVYVIVIYLPEVTSITSADGFAQCMRVMEALRGSYFGMEYATRFVNAAFERESLQNLPNENTQGGSGQSKVIGNNSHPLTFLSMLTLLQDEKATPNTAGHDFISEEVEEFVNATSDFWLQGSSGFEQPLASRMDMRGMVEGQPAGQRTLNDSLLDAFDIEAIIGSSTGYGSYEESIPTQLSSVSDSKMAWSMDEWHVES